MTDRDATLEVVRSSCGTLRVAVHGSAPADGLFTRHNISSVLLRADLVRSTSCLRETLWRAWPKLNCGRSVRAGFRQAQEAPICTSMSSETRPREAVHDSLKQLREQHAAALDAVVNTFIEAAIAERAAEVAEARAQVEAAAQQTLEEKLSRVKAQADADLAEARAGIAADAQQKLEKAMAETEAHLAEALKSSADAVANARAVARAARDHATAAEAAAEDARNEAAAALAERDTAHQEAARAAAAAEHARREAAGARAERDTAREEAAQVCFELAKVRDELASARVRIENVVKAVSDAPGAERETEPANTSRLLEGVKTLDDAGSLTDVLDVLVYRARREAARAAILLVRGDQILGWRLAGFDSAVPDPGTIQLNLKDSGAIVEAVRSGVPKIVGPQLSGLDFAPLPADRAGLAVPVQCGGRTVAVLYADDFGMEAGRVPSAWPEVVEVLVRHAGRCLETITALHSAPEQQGEPGDGTSESSGMSQVS